MRLTNPRLWAVLLPTAAIILVDYARHKLEGEGLHAWWNEAALLMGVLAVILATSQALFRRIERSQRREREAETLRQIGMEITSSLDLDAILASVLTRGCAVLGVDCLGVVMADPPRRELIMQTRGSTGPRRMQAPPGTDFLLEAMERGECREVGRDTPASAEGVCMFCRRCLAVPLRMGSEVLGALCAGSSRLAPFSPEDRELASQMANLASVAIANALLHERARNLATLEERDRIAREMHDSLAQVLGYLSMRASVARELLQRGDLEPLAAELVEMGKAADDAYLDVREAILGLRVSSSRSGGLAEALYGYIEKFSRQSGVAAQLDVQGGEPLELPPRIEMQLVRVIQEALTNVRKHARASNTLVKLKRHDGLLSVSVEDDGQGFDSTRGEMLPGGGYGIATMRERVSGIGGRLAIESAPGNGTIVVATVPLATSEGARNGES